MTREVPVLKALPERLTRACVAPADLTDPTPTNAEHASYTAALQSAFDQCADQVDEIRDLQP